MTTLSSTARDGLTAGGLTEMDLKNLNKKAIAFKDQASKNSQKFFPDKGVRF